MIVAFDMTSGGTAHVPINRGLLTAMALAFPELELRFHAEADHIEALRAGGAAARPSNLSLFPISLSPLHRRQTHIVSGRRFRHELATIRTALRAARRETGREARLIVLASATPTAILAARIAGLSARRPIPVQVGLHGNLNEVIGWRSRNPLVRRLDLHAMLSRPGRHLRLLAFETVIRDALDAIIPGSHARTDVLPHPVDDEEARGHPAPGFDGPLRIGLVGQATDAKGIGPYLETARMFRARFGDRIEFHIVGSRPPKSSPDRFADIAHPVEPKHIPRDVFAARMASLHYVFLPLEPSYYSLSPSGGLMDAVAWSKPVIATRVPITEALFAEGGDIGHLCEGLDDMRAVLERLLTGGLDQARYAAQAEALGRLRRMRGAEAQAANVAAILRQGFPAHFGRQDAAGAAPGSVPGAAKVRVEAGGV